MNFSQAKNKSSAVPETAVLLEMSIPYQEQHPPPPMEAVAAEAASHPSSSFKAQMNALMRKNATFQKRNMRSNIRLVVYPVILCLVLLGVQKLVDVVKMVDFKFRCNCEACGQSPDDDKLCPFECSLTYTDLMSGVAPKCPVPHPIKIPALLQLPRPEDRAVRRKNSSTSNYYPGLPDESCQESRNCPVTILHTGKNRSLALSLGQNLFGSETLKQHSATVDPLTLSSKYLVGTTMRAATTQFFDPALNGMGEPIYIVQPKCPKDFALITAIKVDRASFTTAVRCLEGLLLWREDSMAIGIELYRGYYFGNSENKTNEYLAAYDFLNTNENTFNVTVWHNGTYQKDEEVLRILRALNAASNSYLQFFKGDQVQMVLDFVKDMPKGISPESVMNFSTLMAPLFFTWVIELLLPVMLIYIVYEKQRNLRMIMKMHGLGDRAYYAITYAYFLSVSFAYVLCLVIFGSSIGLRIFTLTDYSIQFVFYFVYINLQIALAFLISALFSKVKTATVIAYIYVFASGLIGSFLFEKLLRNASVPRIIIQVMEFVPGFALYRGLYELAQYSYEVEYIGSDPVSWQSIGRDKEGLLTVLFIMTVEWLLLLLLAYYLDQITSNGSGVRKHPLWFLPCFHGRQKMYEQRQGYNVLLNMEKPDVSQERGKVERLLRESDKRHVVICDDLKKVYPKSNGAPEKHAVRGLSLALLRGECFGILGPNGAGKTSFINMMTGLTSPTSGRAFVEGMDIREDMDKVYTMMGICPQHDLIWETLTGREHLLFYGRLKNLEGDVLAKAVEESLERVNLVEKGVADKMAGKYSGGMKRRLSVAISLIGNPRVVYLDEPSTGLDPASRKKLWRAVQHAKKDRAMILTTHSMEEAEVLCDRVGIFVDGSLECIGNPRELRARYGGYFVLTMTTPPNQEDEVEKLVHHLSASAKKVYHLSGTQKFHLPKQEVGLADVFREVENAKRRLNIQAWGLADATLEDVFNKVARGAKSIS